MLRTWLHSLAIATVFATMASAQVGRADRPRDLNLASAADLARVPGVSAAVVKTLTSQRPFLSATALDDALKSALSTEQRTVLYRDWFVAIDATAAGAAELRLIPGIGEPVVQAIVTHRPYQSLGPVEKTIGAVAGGEAETTRIVSYLFVPIELNSASDGDILSIPGVGRRMLHEFKEYRPYRSLEQFKREIGKYVDGKELARLQRYVRLDRSGGR